MSIPREKLRWNGWGWTDAADPLAGRPEALAWIAATLGMGARLPDTPAMALGAITVPPPRLPPALLARLEACVPAGAVVTSTRERAFHARGKSYHDLLHLRAGRMDALPDAVVYPETPDQALAVIQWAEETGAAVVPYGGGSSVVGGVEAWAGAGRVVVSVDMTRMDKLLATDPVSLTATAEAGIYGPALEAALASHGLTLGHYPQSFELSTLGGWIAARGAGQQSNRYGKAETWLIGAELATPRGLWQSAGFPASAAGPDLTRLIAGSEGTLGLITKATFKVHQAPEARDYRAYLMPDFESGASAIRAIVQSETPVAALRLSDPDETRFFRAFAAARKPTTWRDGIERRVLGWMGVGARPCLLLAGFEGGSDQTRWSRRAARALIRRAGGVAVGRRPADRWYAGRFHGPYLRDPLMDRGIGVDTLETATFWSSAPELYGAVHSALQTAMREHAASESARGIVMAHISHSYPDGASLYFTFIFPRKLSDEVGQWRAIKRAATDAIVRHGGTISHHHGVGVDHAAWLKGEKGPIGMEVLRAVKRALDPANVMNPGKLLE
ncbi:MAG: FAD-binding oxidoreductase [Gemmatimonadota bacterium]